MIFNALTLTAWQRMRGEARNPGRNIPLSIAIVACMVTGTNVVRWAKRKERLEHQGSGKNGKNGKN
jgi:hypothetical protein